MAEGFHCCNLSLLLSLSLLFSDFLSFYLSLFFFTSLFLFPSCLFSLILPCVLPHPSFLSPSFSSSSSFVHPPSISTSVSHSLLSITLSQMPHHTTRSLPLSLLLSLSLSLSLFYPSAPCSLIRSTGSSPAVSSFAAAEQQLASFRAGSKEGKARATVRVQEEKVEEDKKEKNRRKGGGGGDLLLGIHPSPHPSLEAAASAPLPPPPPLLLLDPPSPAGICLLLLLRELLLKLGGGGRSPPPSLPWTLSKDQEERRKKEGGEF